MDLKIFKSIFLTPKTIVMKEYTPAALRNKKAYDGKIYTTKELIEHLILKEGFINKEVIKNKSYEGYKLSNLYGRSIIFRPKASKKYIDEILLKTKQGAKVEMEHKGTIEAIKKPGIKTKDAAVMIAADHISENKNYYDKLDEAKLEKGGPIQDLSKGTVLQGPSHAKGGVEIQVNNKPVAEAEGGEVVINKKSSKLFCEELSEINQKGGGKALNCDTCEHKDTCEHSMAKGGNLPKDSEYEFFYSHIKSLFGNKLSSFSESTARQQDYFGNRVFVVKPTDLLTIDESQKITNDFNLRIVKNAKGDIGITETDNLQFIYVPEENIYLILLNKKTNTDIYLKKGGKITKSDFEEEIQKMYQNLLNQQEKEGFSISEFNKKYDKKANEIAQKYNVTLEKGGEIPKSEMQKEFKESEEITIYDFRPAHDKNHLKITKSVVYYAGMPIHTLKKENATGYFSSKYLYSAIGGTQNFNLGTIALTENNIETIKNKVRNFIVIEAPIMKDGGPIELPINGDEFDEEIDYFDEGGQINERVAQALREKESGKEFKDTDIVSYTRKYSAAYDLVTSGDLDKIEQDNVTAYKLIEKSKVWEPYNIESLKEEGNSSGAAYLKVKAREALSARPLDSKDARRVYVENIEALKLKLQSAKKTNEVKDILYDIANLRTFNYGIIPDNIKVARYGETRERKYFEEIFGKKFYNFCKVSSDSAKKIVVEARLYEQFTESDKEQVIQLRKREIESRIDKANKILSFIITENDTDKIREFVKSIDESYWNSYDKKSVSDYYNRQLEANNGFLNNVESSLSKMFAVRENDWSWTNPKDKSETTKEEAEAKEPVSIFEKYGIEDWRKSTKRLPLDFIKRTGGLQVDEIAVDKVTSKFGYRNVIFGNYVNDKERKESLKHFLGAMLDLHEIMNMDIQEINKLGGLDINFGSTGCGAFSSAMACYMPQLKAINLTKKKGDGCIAHEWSHYLDNVLGEGTERKATKQIYATQFNTYLKGSEKIKLAFLEYIKWLNEGGEDRTILVEFNPTKKYRYQLYGDTAEKAIEAIQRQRNYYAQYKNATDKNVLRYFGYIAYKLNGNKPIVVPMKTTQCGYMVQSAAYGGPEYWTNPKELFARSFEWFIENELKKQNRASTYLVDTTKSLGDLYYIIPFDQHPYPRTKSDEEFLTNWFKKLFSIIRSEYSIAPFNWDTNTRVDEFLDYSDEQKRDLIDTGVKVLSTGKILVEGDDIELAENGYAFKRNIIENKQVYTVLLNNKSINTYLSKINYKDWSVFTQDDAGNNYIFDSFNKLEEAKEYVLKNKLQKQEISEMDKMVAAIPAKDFQEMKQNSGIPEFKTQTTMPKIQPVLNEPSDKYYLLMDYFVNNRIDFTKLPIEIHEQLDELLDLTTSYTDKDSWEGILPDSKKADNAIDKLSKYPHKIIRALWNDIEYKKAVYDNLIYPGIQLYDTIMEQYPNAIISEYEKAANYSLFDDFADMSDKTDLRNMTLDEFYKKSIETDMKAKVAFIVRENPENYTSEEKANSHIVIMDLLGQYQTIIRGAINQMYYDKKITECVLSYSRVREIITSANLTVPKHYKLLSETSCANRKSKAKNSNKLKIDALTAKISDEKAKAEKQKADAEAQQKELKALKQKTKQSVKSVRTETETVAAKAKKLKIAKAKSAAQKQRIRILAINK